MSTINGGPRGIITDGLILRLEAGNPRSYTPGSGTWYDLSPSGMHAAVMNSPTYDSSNGGSLVFNGTNQYATGSVATEYNTLKTYTFNLWAYRSNTGYMVQFRGPTWFPWMAVGGFLTPLQFNDIYDPLNVDGTYPRTAPSNTWFNFCGVQTANSQIVYVNGEYRRTLFTPSVNIYDLGQVYTIGSAALSNYLNGKISSFCVYKRALSSTEIVYNYNASRRKFGM